MSGCCDPRGCDHVFGPRFARHIARRYRRRGLDATAQRMIAFLESTPRGVTDATVLEIGGGVGAIQLELLSRGARAATNVELIDVYEGQAAELARDAGVADRIDRRRGDVAVDPDVAQPADLVVLHRVVCCYPDVRALVGAAASHAREAVVLSHPPTHLVVRALNAVQNAFQALLRHEYRGYVHSPTEMAEILGEHGFTVTHRRRGLLWHTLGAVRAA